MDNLRRRRRESERNRRRWVEPTPAWKSSQAHDRLVNLLEKSPTSRARVSGQRPSPTRAERSHCPRAPEPTPHPTMPRPRQTSSPLLGSRTCPRRATQLRPPSRQRRTAWRATRTTRTARPSSTAPKPLRHATPCAATLKDRGRRPSPAPGLHHPRKRTRNNTKAHIKELYSSSFHRGPEPLHALVSH